MDTRTMVGRSIFTASLMFIVLPAWAAVKLDKLTQCSDIQELYDALRADRLFPTSCREPQSRLDKEIRRRLAPPNSTDICFWDSIPAKFVTGFSCLSNRRATRSILCTRSIPLSDVTEYQERFSAQYAVASKEYTRLASQCRVSNGDSSESAESLLPPPLSQFTEFSFGFASQLGTTIPSDSLVHHGFAKVDQKLFPSEVQAVEFITMYIANPETAPNALQTVPTEVAGNWDVAIDDADEFEQRLQREARRAGAPVFADYTIFEVASRLREPFSDSAKRTKIASWQQGLSQSLRKHGFVELSRDDLDGKSFTDIRKQFLEKFDRKDMGVVSDTGMLLQSRNVPRCARNQGLMMAVIMAVEPNSHKRAAFGAVIFAIVGADACGRRHGAPEAYVDAVIQDAKSDFLDALRSTH